MSSVTTDSGSVSSSCTDSMWNMFKQLLSPDPQQRRKGRKVFLQVEHLTSWVIKCHYIIVDNHVNCVTFDLWPLDMIIYSWAQWILQMWWNPLIMYCIEMWAQSDLWALTSKIQPAFHQMWPSILHVVRVNWRREVGGQRSSFMNQQVDAGCCCFGV